MTKRDYPTMTPGRYVRAVQRLGLSVYASAPVIGVSLRQAQRFSSGESPVPEPVAKLLEMFQRHGIPEEWR